MLPWAVFYLVLITLAEILTAAIEPHAGIVLHSIILVILLLQGATTRQTQLRRLLLTLTLSPLIRILSISLPLQNIALVNWYLIIGALAFAGAIFAARILGISYQRMGFTLKDWPKQIPIGLLGLGLGLTEFLILRPSALTPPNWVDVLYASFVLMIFTGLLEEFIFRGLVQETATSALGRVGIPYGALLFAVLHIGYLSFIEVVFVFTVGMIFGVIVQRTRSLLGVTLAHGMTNISLYLIFPLLLSNPGGVIQPAIKDNVTIGISAPPATPRPSFSGKYSTATATPGIVPPLSLTPTLQASLTLTATAILPSPTAANTVACTGIPAGWLEYTVQPGDSLYALSLRFNVSIQSIRAANCLQTTTLVTGQKLYLPAQPQPSPTATEEPIVTETAAPSAEPSITPEPPTPEPPTPEPPTETATP